MSKQNNISPKNILRWLRHNLSLTRLFLYDFASRLSNRRMHKLGTGIGNFVRTADRWARHYFVDRPAIKWVFGACKFATTRKSSWHWLSESLLCRNKMTSTCRDYGVQWHPQCIPYVSRSRHFRINLALVLQGPITNSSRTGTGPRTGDWPSLFFWELFLPRSRKVWYRILLHPFRPPNCSRWRRGTSASSRSSWDSDLESFSHNPSGGSFAALAYQPSPWTKCLDLRFLSHWAELLPEQHFISR